LSLALNFHLPMNQIPPSHEIGNGDPSAALLHTQEPHTAATATEGDIKPSRSVANASAVQLLFLQVKAFLEATEDVDVEPETIQELLELLHNKQLEPSTASMLENASHENSEDDEDYDPEKPEHELDISALFTQKDDG
jgi:hypothetical protein